MPRIFRALSHLPPPLLFVAPLMLGIRIDRLHPLALVSGSFAKATSILGVALVVSGVVLALSAIGLFARRRTTIVPHRRSSALVTSGPFRLTRNPMYVALTCAFVGVCLFTNAAWPLPFLVLPLTYLQAITIPREERLLLDAFGVEYQTYMSRVHRWL